mgnify:CR=1 FL=1
MYSQSGERRHRWFLVEEDSVESIGEERLYIQRNTGIVSNIGVITPKCAKKSDSSLEHGRKSIVLYHEVLIVRPDILVNDLVTMRRSICGLVALRCL